MPAKAGIHSHRPVFMDSGFRRNDNSKLHPGPVLVKYLSAAANA
jgi:hypothetical protein